MGELKFVHATQEELEALIGESLKQEFLEIKKELNSYATDKNKVLTKEETAKFLKIDLSTLWRWTKKGLIKAHSIGNRVYYFMSDINKALLPIN